MIRCLKIFKNAKFSHTLSCLVFLVDKNELKEELREDNAVKVSRKELNELITELFEYADIYKSNLNQNKINLDNEPQITILHEKNEEGKDGEPEVCVV